MHWFNFKPRHTSPRGSTSRIHHANKRLTQFFPKIIPKQKVTGCNWFVKKKKLCKEKWEERRVIELNTWPCVSQLGTRREKQKIPQIYSQNFLSLFIKSRVAIAIDLICKKRRERREELNFVLNCLGPKQQKREESRVF